MLRIVVDGTPEHAAEMERLGRRGEVVLDAVEPAVRAILADVRARGEIAVLDCISRFEQRTPARLVTHEYDGPGALARLEPALAASLRAAAARIRAYHEHQIDRGFAYVEAGVALAQRVRALDRVGVYAPGGKARYPSSVLMTAIPAQVAGVREIVLATPAPSDVLLAAAALAGVTSILDAGGAHAIAALAYGTSSLGRVDKIAGPGNAYVTCAKKLVFGAVDIDGIAGPSELLALADETADPEIVAIDLLSQAEHDEEASVILLASSEVVALAVNRALAELLPEMERRAIIERALPRGVAIVARDRARLAELANAIGAEHVSVQTRDAPELASRIYRAGAVLVGRASSVASGDYFAGPSHVLPTGSAVRFGSPLGVHDFLARSSWISYGASALADHGPDIVRLARSEGLDAHAQAVERRLARSSAWVDDDPALPVSVPQSES